MSADVAFEVGRLYAPLKQIADRTFTPVQEFLRLPVLRAFWPMGAGDASNDVIDLAGAGRTMTNTDCIFGASGLASFVSFNGSTSLLNRPSEPGLDITGPDAAIEPEIWGITMGGWFRHSALLTNQAYMAKWGAPGNLSWILTKNTSELIRFFISGDGSNILGVTAPMNAGTEWIFVVGRFTSTVSISVFVNGAESTVGTGEGSLKLTVEAVRIGATTEVAPRNFDGKAALCFICACSVPTDQINGLYQATRGIFPTT